MKAALIISIQIIIALVLLFIAAVKHYQRAVCERDDALAVLHDYRVHVETRDSPNPPPVPGTQAEPPGMHFIDR